MGHDMVVSRYEIPTGIPLVDGLSTGPPNFRVTCFEITNILIFHMILAFKNFYNPILMKFYIYIYLYFLRFLIYSIVFISHKF